MNFHKRSCRANPENIKIEECENCSKKHDHTYGSGRFCSEKCSRSFSTKSNINTINIKRSLKQNKPIEKNLEILKNELIYKFKNYLKRNFNIIELSQLNLGYIKMITEILQLSCSQCGWNLDICDIHHIFGKDISVPDNPKNLAYLCPNCHRLAQRLKIKPEELINIEDYIGDMWKNIN
jgi:Zn finger protein HypA/HybF involved in hydrogenase expression